MKFFSKHNEDDFLLTEEPLNSNIVTPKEDKPTPSHKLTIDEVLGGNKPNTERFDGKSALASLKERMLAGTEAPQSAPVNDKPKSNEDVKFYTPSVEVKEEPKAEHKVSLLEKCKPFITDEDGNEASVTSAPLYKLESVAEILESNRKKSIDRLAQQYNITVDDLGKVKKEEQPKPQPK